MLFISSGNNKDGLSPIIKSQGVSLICQGVQVEYFTIQGQGFWSYFHYIFKLRKHLKLNKYDIIHAHYSFSSYVASLAGSYPLVVSLMGSDILSNRVRRIWIFLFHKLYWNKTLVKSSEMYYRLGLKNVEIIPNGVNIDSFYPIDKKDCQNRLGWNYKQKHILFAADPGRPEKNFALAEMTIALLKIDFEIVMHVLKDIPYKNIAVYLNAADVVLLTSLYEGSPNIIKEGMACNCPIVSTDVGDVKWVIGDTKGCYITSFNPDNIAENIKNALIFDQKTNGRDRIFELYLDDKSIANNILDLYKKVLIVNI